MTKLLKLYLTKSLLKQIMVPRKIESEDLYLSNESSDELLIMMNNHEKTIYLKLGLVVFGLLFFVSLIFII